MAGTMNAIQSSHCIHPSNLGEGQVLAPRARALKHKLCAYHGPLSCVKATCDDCTHQVITKYVALAPVQVCWFREKHTILATPVMLDEPLELDCLVLVHSNNGIFDLHAPVNPSPKTY